MYFTELCIIYGVSVQCNARDKARQVSQQLVCYVQRYDGKRDAVGAGGNQYIKYQVLRRDRCSNIYIQLTILHVIYVRSEARNV